MEKHYICPECGDLTTETTILQEIGASGGSGMCLCEFTTPYWNEGINDFGVDTPRTLNKYNGISRLAFDRLKDKPQHERVKLLRLIPPSVAFPKEERIAELEAELKKLKAE